MLAKGCSIFGVDPDIGTVGVPEALCIMETDTVMGPEIAVETSLSLSDVWSPPSLGD